MSWNERIAPTASELIELARQELDPATRQELLAAAETAALGDRTMCSTYLVDVARVHASISQPDEAHRLLHLAVAHADDRIWDYRHAANVWLELGDRESARAALEQYEEVLRNSSQPGYLWRLLAEGFAEGLQDAAGVARCIARATAMAASVDDHCSVAAALWELAGDMEGAREALTRASALAEEGTERQAWWTLANAYSRLGDDVGVRSTLLRGSEVARSVEQHLVIAAAWQSQFPGAPAIIDSLRAAQQLASTAPEWLEIAEAHFDCGSPDAIRTCLEAAAALAQDADDAHRVARGFRRWLDDHDRADAIAPAGLRPAQVADERVPLAGWLSDAGALLDWLRPQMTAERLAEIAAADYGMDADQHLAALREIVETGLICWPLDWHPGEVLELTRWTRGTNIDHVVRGFACTVLCVAGTNSGADRSEADIIILLESCLALGVDVVSRLQGLLVAMVESSTDVDEDVVYHAPDTLVGLLLVTAALDPGDPRLDQLAKLVLDCDQLDELFTEGMRPELWLQLADELLRPVVAAQPNAHHVEMLAHLARG